MTARICAVDGCDNPIPTSDNSQACPGCWNRYTQALAETPALIRELEITLSRQDALRSVEDVRGTETPLPYHKGASDALTDLLGTLTSWVRATGAQPTSRPWNALLSHDNRGHPDAHQLIHETTAATARGWRTVDTHPDKIMLGPCGTCREPLSYRKGDAITTCRTCGTSWDVAPRREWLYAGFRGTLVTVSDARRIMAVYRGIHIEQYVISRWKTRGQLLVRQHDQEGREMYLFGDIDNLASQRLDKS